MNIWFAASEAVPLVKSGGLADVVGALPKELAKLGHDVSVIIPKYGDIPSAYTERAETVAELNVKLGWRKQYCGLQRVCAEGITYLLVDNEYYFKRTGLYGYGDDAERYVFFSFAVLEALGQVAEMPRLVHAHDWQTGLVPMLLRTRYANRPGYRDIRTVFTIHNLQYQGVFSRQLMQDLLDAGDDLFTQDGLEFFGAASCMKAGLRFADKLTTVSPTYAQEIQTAEYGEKLDGVLRQRAGDLVGIVNGIDTDVYDPMKDPHLVVNYRDSLAKKRQNKPALQREMGLPENADVPLIGIVSRMVSQKGFDLIGEALDELMREDVQLIALGSGDAGVEAMLRHARDRHPDKMAVWFGFNEGLARRVYAASDLYLMPSRFEPCGLSQLIALRYRSVPIVRETGGLRDTIQPYNEFEGTGTGFTFGPPAAHDMMFTIRRALSYYKDPEAWSRITANGARKDYGWGASARAYADLYRKLVP